MQLQPIKICLLSAFGLLLTLAITSACLPAEDVTPSAPSPTISAENVLPLTAPPTTEPALEAGGLTIEEVSSANLQNTAWWLSGSQTTSLSFGDTSVGGTKGCNNYSTTYATSGNLIVFGDEVAATLVACDAGAEAAFFSRVFAANSFEIIDNELTLFNDASVIAKFDEDISENKTMYIGPEQTTCLRPLPRKCLMFKEAPDDEYTAFTGYIKTNGWGPSDSEQWNDWEAGNEYELLVKVSRRTNPPDDFPQTRYTLSTIVNETEVVGVAPQSWMAGPKWVLQSTQGLSNTVLTPPPNLEIFIRVDGDKLAGNAGCNDFSGVVAIVDYEQSFTFDLMSITEKTCSKEIMQVENELLENLTTATTVSFGSRLVITNRDQWFLSLFSLAIEQTLFVGPEKVDCEIFPQEKCFLIKHNPNEEYAPFQYAINDFDWQEGKAYELFVNVTEDHQLLADITPLRYELIEVVSETDVR